MLYQLSYFRNIILSNSGCKDNKKIKKRKKTDFLFFIFSAIQILWVRGRPVRSFKNVDVPSMYPDFHIPIGD